MLIVATYALYYIIFDIYFSIPLSNLVFRGNKNHPWGSFNSIYNTSYHKSYIEINTFISYIFVPALIDNLFGV